MNVYTANVFFPGCLGPLKNEVVLAEEAETQLAALREELAEQEKTWTARFELLCEGAIRPIILERNDAQQRLAVMAECLERLRDCSQLRPTPSLVELIDAALNHKPEAASHERP